MIRANDGAIGMEAPNAVLAATQRGSYQKPERPITARGGVPDARLDGLTVFDGTAGVTLTECPLLAHSRIAGGLTTHAGTTVNQRLRGSRLDRLCPGATSRLLTQGGCMKTMWDEDPTELLGLEEEGGGYDLGGSEQEEDDEPTETMGFGEDEGEEEGDEYDLSGFDEEEDPTEHGMEDDEYDDEEQTPEPPQQFASAGIALGVRARRRARLLGVAALKKRRRARLLALLALRNRKRARLLALAALRNRKRARFFGLAALKSKKRAKLLGAAAIRLRRKTRTLGKATIAARGRAA